MVGEHNLDNGALPVFLPQICSKDQKETPGDVNFPYEKMWFWCSFMEHISACQSNTMNSLIRGNKRSLNKTESPI